MDARDYLDRLARRILMALGLGSVKLSDDTAAVQQVQVAIGDAEVLNDVPRVQEFGFTSRPPADTDAVIVFVHGDRSRGIVIASNHRASRPRGLALGETMIFSEDGKHVHLKAADGIEIEVKGQDVVVTGARDVRVTATGKMTVVAPGGIRFDTPVFEVTGEVKDRTDSDGTTMEAIRSAFDSHKHSGVASGSATTDVPTESI